MPPKKDTSSSWIDNPDTKLKDHSDTSRGKRVYDTVRTEPVDRKEAERRREVVANFKNAVDGYSVHKNLARIIKEEQEFILNEHFKKNGGGEAYTKIGELHNKIRREQKIDWHELNMLAVRNNVIRKSLHDITVKINEMKLKDSDSITGKSSDNQPQKISEQKEVMAQERLMHYTSEGTPFWVLDLKGQLDLPSAQQDRAWMTERFGPLTPLEDPTDAYNGFAEALTGKKIGMIPKQTAEIVLQDNFYPIDKPPKADDRLIYRDPKTRDIHAILTVVKSDDGKLRARGQIDVGRGFYIYHDLDRIQKVLGCTCEVHRQKEGAFARSFLECFAPGEDHVTTRGKRVRVFYPTKDIILLSPKADKQRVAEKKRDYLLNGVEPPEPLEDPKPYNCFGHGILKKGGVIAEGEEADKAINDDFVIIENTTQVGDWKICRGSSNQPEHMAEIMKMSKRKVDKLSSKDGSIAGLWEHNLDTLEKTYPGTWETRYKKTNPKNDLKREIHEYTAYQKSINNPDSTGPFTPTELAAILTVTEEFKKRAELGIKKSHEGNEKNAQKHLELFRTRRLELLSLVKGQKKKEIHQPTAFDENDPDKHLWERHESLVMKQAKLDFENSLLRNTMETHGFLPKDSPQTEERSLLVSLLREKVVQTMLDGKEQGPVLDEFETFVQGQDQRKKDLFQKLNEWTKSLQQKVEQSHWSKDLKNYARAYLDKLEEILTSPDETLRESLLYRQFEQSLGALLKMSETDPNQPL